MMSLPGLHEMVCSGKSPFLRFQIWDGANLPVRNGTFCGGLAAAVHPVILNRSSQHSDSSH